MSDHSTIIEKAQQYVQALLEEHLSPIFVFHNYEHTQEVVEIADKIANATKLPPDKREVLLLAACFQYTGYVKADGEVGSESVAIAEAFLEGETYAPTQLAEVKQLILSNTPGHTPTCLSEKILHDASWSFLGRKRFSNKQKLMRLEQEKRKGTHFSEQAWNRHLLGLLEDTLYYSSWAQKNYTLSKNDIRLKLRQDLTKAEEANIRSKTGKNFGRGIDTIYRVNLSNHINLSSIADGKANMIISVNTTLLTVLVGIVGAGISINDTPIDQIVTFAAPMGILLLSSLIAIVFATLSAIPKVSSATFDQEDLKAHRVSMLYFGNFLQLEKEIFVDYLRQLKWDQEVLYDDLSRDLYSLGVVLRKKYKLLTIAYQVFMGGLVLSVVVLIISYILFET